MSKPSLFSRLRGPFNFLDSGSEPGPRAVPDAERLLPTPGHIFLEEEASTPVLGFAVYRSAKLIRLNERLRNYLESEERAQLAKLRSSGFDFDIRDHQQRWERYRSCLVEISRNVMTSNYGRSFPQLFWLYHSLDLVNGLKGTSNRILQQDLRIGRQHGDAIRYQVLSKYLDRVFAEIFDLSGKLASETEQSEDELFPPLLTRMRDNVLIFTEDHVGKDLQELSSYFRGYLQIDGADFLYRLALLRRWHDGLLRSDRFLRSAARHLLVAQSDTTPDGLLLRQGYLAFLRRHPEYDEEVLLRGNEVKLWESLLTKLKEFELFHSVRRLIVEVEHRDGNLWCDASAAKRLGAGTGPTALNAETRPFDFAASWIVDPEVSRGGLIYDLVDFSSLVSRLRMSDASDQDSSFRQIFFFQRQVNRLASKLRLRMEKYLGDGAFYSGRSMGRLLIAAVLIQRAYREALSSGLPFDRGLRMALNHGAYRLLPLGGSSSEGYEVFGYGLVELSRLVSGKRRLDIDGLKTTMMTYGYDEAAVHEFFGPLADAERHDSDLAGQRFFAQLESDGSLVNNGIVVTAPFLQELDNLRGSRRIVELGRRRYVAFELATEDGTMSCVAGARRLGLARLKGLDRVDVYEVVDGEGWDLKSLPETGQGDILATLNQSFSSALAGS